MNNRIKAINSAAKDKLASVRSRKALQELFYRWMQNKSSPEKIRDN